MIIGSSTRFSGGFDADAKAYFDAILAAGSTISVTNQRAVNAFVKGCKIDGIWSAIKAACFLAGPDDLTGALVPLVGTAPTNNGFVSGDHSRTGGLKGDSSSYLDANRANNADPQDDNHNAVYISEVGGYDRQIGGNSSSYTTGDNVIATSDGFVYYRSRNNSSSGPQGSDGVGLLAMSRSASAEYAVINPGGTATITQNSQTPSSASVRVFAGGTGPASVPSDSRIGFYSVGESLNLTLLKSRIDTYFASIL